MKMKPRAKTLQKTTILNPVLIDAVAMSRAHPATFVVPNTNFVKKGQWVKVAIKGVPRGERFWVEVEQRKGDLFVGRIDNDLVTTRNLKYDDRIAFHARNIHMIYPE